MSDETSGYAKGWAFDGFKIPHPGLDEPMPINPLSVASSQELIDELKTRHRALLVCVMDVDDNAGNEGVERVRNAFYGGGFTCVGMAQKFIHDHLTGNHDTDEGFEREE